MKRVAGAAALGCMLGLGATAVAADKPGHRAESTVTYGRDGDQLTVAIRNVTYTTTGELVSPRARRERLLLRLETATREVIGDKGIEGDVRLVVLPLESAAGDKPIFEVVEKGRAVTFEAENLVSVDRDDCCAYDRAYYSLWTGARLFEATTAPAWVEIGKEFRTHRVAAFRAATDDVQDAQLKAPGAVGLITYAASDRVIREIVISADKPSRAEELRSLWDERVAISWVDAATGAPLPSEVSAGPGARPALRLLFVQAKLDLRIPLEADDLAASKATGAAGLRLAARPAQPLAGAWHVATSVVGPWAKGSPDEYMRGRHLVFGPRAMRSGTVMDCADARFETRDVPPEGLFVGALQGADAVAEAAKVGLTAKAVSSTLVTCSAGVFDFHLKEPGVALFALDNRIYTLERANP